MEKAILFDKKLGQTEDGDEYIELTFRIYRDTPPGNEENFERIKKVTPLGQVRITITERW